MNKILPILFRTDMVRAILDGRKTATRIAVRYKYSNTEIKMHTDKYGTSLIEIQKDVEGETFGKNPDGRSWRKLLPYIKKEPPCKPGDTLYVRETWTKGGCAICERDECYGSCGAEKYLYRADFKEDVLRSFKDDGYNWKPSIHMPKEAARIFLKVTDVRVEKLDDIDGQDVLKEGLNSLVHPKASYFDMNQREMFEKLWNSKIKKSDIGLYGWDANPWVWVIEFERCEKPEEL